MPAVSRMLAAALCVVGVSVACAPPAAHAMASISAADGLTGRPAPTEPARGLRVAGDGSDPEDVNAWHLNGDGPMGVRSAWTHTTGGDVTVAILDTGIDETHPDLAPNLWVNPGEIPRNGIDDDHDGVVDDIHGVDLVNDDGDPADDNGHGTHVAGIIGAVGGNGIGASGVAWRVRLMAVKVLDADAGGNTGTVARGIDWAVAHGARVINLSLAGAGRSAGMEASIVAAQQAGVLIVVAAGNDHADLGLTPSYPASYPEANVLGVAATRPDSLLSSISDFGTGTDLSAPGETILSTALGGGYEYRTGTSMAAPMVAGAAALVLAAAPGSDAAGVAAALKGTARRTGLPVGAGALDVGAALGGPPTSAAAATAARPAKAVKPVVSGRPRPQPSGTGQASAVITATTRKRAARLRSRRSRASLARARAARTRTRHTG